MHNYLGSGINSSPEHRPTPESASRERQKRKLAGFYASGGRREYIFDSRYHSSDKDYEEALSRMGREGAFEGEERQLLSEIKGPVDFYGPEAVLDHIHENRQANKILGFFAGNPEDYNSTSVSSLQNFLTRYKTPKDFEDRSSWFINMVAERNAPKKVAEYINAMAQFKSMVYGKKQEYWDAMKEFRSEAVEYRNRRRRIGNSATRTVSNFATNNEYSRSYEQENPVKSCGIAMRSKGELKGNPNLVCEDAAIVDKNKGFFAVFDGAGGHIGGAAAANIAKTTVENFVDSMEPDSPFSLGQVLTYAARNVEASRRQGTAGYTTGTIGRIVREGSRIKLVYASVGDSRIYIVRNGKAEQVTKDEGYRNIVTNILGASNFEMRQAGERPLLPGDNVVFCTDGITGDVAKDFIPNDEFGQIVSSAPNAETAARRLANRATKIDDRTAIVVRI